MTISVNERNKHYNDHHKNRPSAISNTTTDSDAKKNEDPNDNEKIRQLENAVKESGTEEERKKKQRELDLARLEEATSLLQKCDSPNEKPRQDIEKIRQEAMQRLNQCTLDVWSPQRFMDSFGMMLKHLFDSIFPGADFLAGLQDSNDTANRRTTEKAIDKAEKGAAFTKEGITEAEKQADTVEAFKNAFVNKFTADDTQPKDLSKQQQKVIKKRDEELTGLVTACGVEESRAKDMSRQEKADTLFNALFEVTGPKGKQQISPKAINKEDLKALKQYSNAIKEVGGYSNLSQLAPVKQLSIFGYLLPIRKSYAAKALINQVALASMKAEINNNPALERTFKHLNQPKGTTATLKKRPGCVRNAKQDDSSINLHGLSERNSSDSLVNDDTMVKPNTTARF